VFFFNYVVRFINGDDTSVDEWFKSIKNQLDTQSQEEENYAR